MIRISVQNKPLFLADKITPEIEDYLHRPETIFIDELSPAAIKTMLHELEQPDYYTGVFLHQDVKALLTAFKSQLNVIPASGGLVHTAQNDLLLIFRLGRWDLPKGKLDEGESLEDCAIREIEEETGAKGLSVERALQVTYHTYHQNGKNNLKESHWFLVKAAAKTPLTPQTDENVEKCIWVPIEKIQPYIDGSFATVADVLKQGVSILKADVR